MVNILVELIQYVIFVTEKIGNFNLIKTFSFRVVFISLWKIRILSYSKVERELIEFNIHFFFVEKRFSMVFKKELNTHHLICTRFDTVCSTSSKWHLEIGGEPRLISFLTADIVFWLLTSSRWNKSLWITVVDL